MAVPDFSGKPVPRMFRDSGWVMHVCCLHMSPGIIFSVQTLVHPLPLD